MYRLDRPTSSEEDRDRAVEVRLQKQSLLTRRLPAAPQVDQILSEAVLRRIVSGSTVMTSQPRPRSDCWRTARRGATRTGSTRRARRDRPRRRQ
ncbi:MULTISPECIES: Scr1 family TA system antitoxin-like transcriptional regulator [unclassified Micromonospora]